MKRLILKTLVFISMLILVLVTLLFLPATPRASKSLLFSSVTKDSLLANTTAPRIIFVGGSNLSFGLNSQIIKDSLNLNPINTAIHANIGIKYMFDNTLKKKKKGDIVIFVSEYSLFNRDWNDGTEELFRTVFDCNKNNIKLLNIKQLFNCFLYAGNFILSKFDITEYVKVKESDVYSVNSFNQYGDVDAHWYLEDFHTDCKPFGTMDINKYNPKIMTEIKRIADRLQEKGCILFISYPGLQESSFNNSKETIKKIEAEFQAHGFTVLGTPQKYLISDSLIFDTPYHLNKQGVELRTNLLIEDLKIALNNIDSFEFKRQHNE
jgi:hypothetical protein